MRGGEVFFVADHASKDADQKRDRAGGVGPDGIETHHEQGRKGENGAATGDGVDHAGDDPGTHKRDGMGSLHELKGKRRAG